MGVIIACCFAAVPALAVAPLVSATLEPRQISMGQSAQLTITSSGTGMDAVTLPVVSGLEFRIVGQSRRIEMINGATLGTTSIVMRVTPQEPGLFTIPGITPKSQPLVLKVNPDNGSGASSNPPSSSNRTTVIPGGSSVDGIRLTADGSAFVRLNLPKHEAYVGESIPVEIEVGMRAGFVTSLNGFPTLTGSEFTLNNLSRQPQRVEKLIDGKPFTVMTWHSVLAPVKPGNFTLAVESPLTVRVRTRPQRDSMIDDLLGDPFMQNFFGPTVSKDIKVSSPPTTLTVLALPVEGRPPDFSGAVGEFKIDSDLSAKTAAAGDPLTLRMRVTGSGNFDRVDSSMLDHIDQWKTYPPKSAFKPSDTVGFKGEKTFEQPLIATRPGAQTLPALTFSYFDPASRHYETARSSPLNVNISPSLADSTASQPPAPALAAAAPKQPAGLRPDHSATGATAASLMPLYLRPRFLALPSLLALMFAGGWLGLRHRADADRTLDSRERSLPKTVSRVLKQLESAAGAGDSAGFLNCARTALQHSLGARWGLAADQVNSAEVETRLGGEAAVGEIFTRADEANYSGASVTTPDFDRWTRIVREQLVDENPA